MGSYSRLAALMVAQPDVAIFRTFSKLNAKNLLYYQAELAILEDELAEIERSDQEQASTSDRGKFHKRFRSLAEKYREEERALDAMPGMPQNPKDPEEHLQWKTFLEIRELLRAYSE